MQSTGNKIRFKDERTDIGHGQKETESICIWPDGMVCRREDIMSYAWASDDYAGVEMPSDEDMYEFAQKYIEEQIQDSCSQRLR